MTIKEFMDSIQKTYNSYFPDSKCIVKLSTYLIPTIDIMCLISKTKDEVYNGYTDNDMLKIRFDIKSTDITLQSKENDIIINDCTLSNYRKNYLIKPIYNKYNYYDSRQLTFRRSYGSCSKILKSLDRFFVKLHDSLIKDLNENNIHDSHIKLLKTKLNIK